MNEITQALLMRMRRLERRKTRYRMERNAARWEAAQMRAERDAAREHIERMQESGAKSQPTCGQDAYFRGM